MKTRMSSISSGVRAIPRNELCAANVTLSRRLPLPSKEMFVNSWNSPVTSLPLSVCQRCTFYNSIYYGQAILNQTVQAWDRALFGSQPSFDWIRAWPWKS